MSSTFVFFHVGVDIRLPTMLAHSIRITNPSSEIIQCSDRVTPRVLHTTRLERFNGDISRLMTYRLHAFAELGLQVPAIYLDTDMLVCDEIRVENLIRDKNAMLCKRNFAKDSIFNSNFRSLNFDEYRGQTLDKVYPILACCTISKNYKLWRELLSILKEKDEKFEFWYGDQEALKEWAKNSSKESIGFLEEKDYACLPDYKDASESAKILHFKGAHRKIFMENFYSGLRKQDTY